MKMFKALVNSVALYGAEVWGWYRDERMDRIQRKNTVKWILGLERVTPNHILEEECKLINISLRSTKRAVRYEEKARISDKKIIKDCMMKMDKRIGEGEVSKWGRKRRDAGMGRNK
ncbi:abl interactor 2-like protein [Lasius niger]|uniref:Abl interactor 2-like protein n=1 Tax=Lasius niger TaxID=67767 RepID=A0A0J7KKE4_LASNI|nr:abl interactor 2-like protein [Lasius niger]